MRFLLSIIFLSAYTYALGQTIKGKVVARDAIIAGASIQLLDSVGSIKAEQYTDLDYGRFKFKNVPAGNYSLKVRFVTYKDTIFKNIIVTKNLKVKLDIHEFCKYDAARKNPTCPSCQKKDEVIPIEYGLPVALNGRDPMENEGNTWKSGGCVITQCDPHWYCKRDKTEF